MKTTTTRTRNVFTILALLGVFNLFATEVIKEDYEKVEAGTLPTGYSLVPDNALASVIAYDNGSCVNNKLEFKRETPGDNSGFQFFILSENDSIVSKTDGSVSVNVMFDVNFKAVDAGQYSGGSVTFELQGFNTAQSRLFPIARVVFNYAGKAQVGTQAGNVDFMTYEFDTTYRMELILNFGGAEAKKPFTFQNGKLTVKVNGEQKYDGAMQTPTPFCNSIKVMKIYGSTDFTGKLIFDNMIVSKSAITGESSTPPTVNEECGISAVSEINISDRMTVAPNPASRYLELLTDEKVIAVKLYTLGGRCVKSLQGEISTLDISDLDDGTYICEVVTEKGVGIKKILVKH